MKSIVITHFPSATDQYHEDMNEIFCGKTTDEINISSGIGGDDNEIKIKLTLERIVSRIDIKFIKVASDNDHIEVPYATGNIFGGTGTTSLTSLIFTSSNVPLKYNLNGEIRIMLQEFNAKSLTLLHHFNTEKPMQMQSRHLITSHSPKMPMPLTTIWKLILKKA